jgi:hypothetical protein
MLATAVILTRTAGPNTSRPQPPQAEPRVIRAGIELAPVPGWKASATAAPVPGLRFNDPIVLQGHASHTRLVVGILPATSPTMLPADLVDRLQAPLGRPATVRLEQGYEAYYYRGLTVAGLGAPLDAYLIPTTSGIVTAACVADRGVPYYDGEAHYYECWKNLTTLRLRDGRALRLRRDAAFRQRLPGAIAMLDAVRLGAREELASRIPATQARAASRVAAACDRAASSLLAVVPRSSRWARRIVAQLRAVGAAYRGVVGPLRRADAASYARGRARAHASERRLERLIQDPDSS